MVVFRLWWHQPLCLKTQNTSGEAIVEEIVEKGKKNSGGFTETLISIDIRSWVYGVHYTSPGVTL